MEEMPAGRPGVSVFSRTADGKINHFYTTEASFAPDIIGQLTYFPRSGIFSICSPEGPQNWIAEALLFISPHIAGGLGFGAAYQPLWKRLYRMRNKRKTVIQRRVCAKNPLGFLLQSGGFFASLRMTNYRHLSATCLAAEVAFWLRLPRAVVPYVGSRFPSLLTTADGPWIGFHGWEGIS